MADRPRKPRGTTKDLIEAGNLVKSARDKIPEVKLFHCSDDEKWQNDMGNRLMEWVDKDTTNALDNFPLSQRLAPRWFYNMAKTNNYFAQCLQYAKARIGSRLHEKVENNQLYIMKSIPLHMTMWEDQEEKRLNSEAKGAAQIITVGIPEITVNK
jgi:hypothetical protein